MSATVPLPSLSPIPLVSFSLGPPRSVASLTSHPGNSGVRSKKKKRTNRIVLEHTQRSVLTRAHEGLVVAGQGHGDEAHGDGA